MTQQLPKYEYERAVTEESGTQYHIIDRRHGRSHVIASASNALFAERIVKALNAQD